MRGSPVDFGGSGNTMNACGESSAAPRRSNKRGIAVYGLSVPGLIQQLPAGIKFIVCVKCWLAGFTKHQARRAPGSLSHIASVRNGS